MFIVLRRRSPVTPLPMIQEALLDLLGCDNFRDEIRTVVSSDLEGGGMSQKTSELGPASSLSPTSATLSSVQMTRSDGNHACSELKTLVESGAPLIAAHWWRLVRVPTVGCAGDI